MIRVLVAALLTGLTALPAQAHPPATLAASERPGLTAAIKAFLARDGSPCARHVYVADARRSGEWARVTVICKDAGDAFAFLKRTGRGWKVALLGTGWSPAELAALGVPAGLR